MVRVIPVHNFVGQKVSQIEEPTTTCVADSSGRELLLLALPSHCVEVHDLQSADLKIITIFPTVDLVRQIIHCATGDYVATLESKVSRDGMHTSNFVRVYVNWAMIESQGHPMRARIAGRVTPSLNQPVNTLEMIELPLNGQPTVITCCQSTGNLLVAIGCSAILHEFKVETQQTTKLKFIDFEARPWSLGFTFSPRRMELVEDFISLLDSTHFLAFQLTNPMYDDIDQLSSLESTNSSSASKTSISTNFSSIEKADRPSQDSPRSKNADDNASVKSVMKKSQRASSGNIETNRIDFGSRMIEKNDNQESIRTNDRQRRLKISPNQSCAKTLSTPYIDWERLIRDEQGEMQRLVARGVVEANSLPFTINLPSISLERASPGHTVNPFVLNPSNMDVKIKTNSPDDGWSENYAVKNLLRIMICANNGKDIATDDESETFTCLQLKPLYLNRAYNNSCMKKSILRSNKFRYLHGITCVICTTQEGYVYHFSAANSQESSPTCLTTYPFTAPVRHVALDNTVLHALTEAGLETYTLRVSHHVARSLNFIDDYKTTCPTIFEPVCLIGLRPFLGIQKLLQAKTCLVLLTRAESSWTLYSLTLPNCEDLYSDFVNTAQNHRDNSPNTYRHLLGEAHTILRLFKDLNRRNNEDANLKNQQNAESKLEVLYRESCALLGDYYINSESESGWDLCIPYYRMSKFKPSEILSRKSVANAPGLLKYLTETLANIKSGPDADALFQTHNVVDLLSTEDVDSLAQLILRSSVAREYATDKLLAVLVNRAPTDSSSLASVLLNLQSEKHDQAKTMLEPIPNAFIENVVREHWHLLFDSTALKKRSRAVPTFSDFCGLLIRDRSETFARIVTRLVEDDVLSLHQVLQVFLEYLPSRVGRDGHDAAAALQLFIETYFANYFSCRSLEQSWNSCSEASQNYATIEAFKILVRSYLGNLTQSKVYKSLNSVMDHNENEKESYLFAECRPLYLNKLPPYADMNCHKLFFTGEKIDAKKTKKVVRNEVPKLQALLASGQLSKDCIREIKQFLDSQEEIEGSLAFKILCIEDTEIVSRILIAQYPLAALQYAKDKYTKEMEWKSFIRLLREELSMFDDHQEAQRFCYEQILTETLTYLAQTLPLDELCRILPKDDETAYRRYTDACRRAGNADHVKSLIIETGHQLLTTLNL